MAWKLELMGRQGDLSYAGETLASLEGELERLKVALTPLARKVAS